MLDGLIAMLPFPASMLWSAGTVPQRGDTLLSGRYPCYNVYETKEGEYISLGALEHRFWAALCKKLGREDYIPHQFDEGEKRQEIFRFLRKTFQEKTSEEWMEELQGLDVCIGKVLHLDEALNDPHVTQRQMIVEITSSQKKRMKLLASPIKLSETPTDIRRAPATFGEHTEEVLKELGFNAGEINRMIREGVV
jgi:crotonobetainyl-CoA:carnitine CoA-transferase CaiB-like acyl-CoA transferase